MVISFQSLTVLTKNPILDVWQGSENASDNNTTVIDQMFDFFGFLFLLCWFLSYRNQSSDMLC